jgi:hypothetical protein
MTRVKFPNGYIGLLKENIAAVMEKKGQIEIIETDVAAEPAPDGRPMHAPGQDEIEELQRKASESQRGNAPRVPRPRR